MEGHSNDSGKLCVTAASKNHKFYSDQFACAHFGRRWKELI